MAEIKVKTPIFTKKAIDNLAKKLYPEEREKSPREQFNKKFKEFYEYVGEVAALNEKDAERYALSIGNLQLHTKEDFCKALEILRFLTTDRKFNVPKKIKEEQHKKFGAMFHCPGCGSKKVGLIEDGRSRYIVHKVGCNVLNPANRTNAG